MRPLTERQQKGLDRVKKNGGREYLSPDLAKQLATKGLVEITGRKYWRTEYNRKVPNTTLWEVALIQTI